MDGRCDFCPRAGRLATCRCPNGHADVGVWVCAEKHEPWLNSVEIACRQCDAGQPSLIAALYETPSAALVAKIERLRKVEAQVREAADGDVYAEYGVEDLRAVLF